MQNIVRQLDRAIGVIALLFGYLAAASTLVLTLVVSYGVIMRSFLNSPQTWTDQIASYSMLWIVFFGLAYTLSTGAHIRVDFFTQLLPVRSEHGREIVVWAIGFAFSLLFFFGCLTMVETFYRRNTHSTAGLLIPLYWPAIPMLLGTGLFSLMMLMHLVRLCIFGSLPSSPQARDSQR